MREGGGKGGANYPFITRDRTPRPRRARLALFESGRIQHATLAQLLSLPSLMRVALRAASSLKAHILILRLSNLQNSCINPQKVTSLQMCKCSRDKSKLSYTYKYMFFIYIYMVFSCLCFQTCISPYHRTAYQMLRNFLNLLSFKLPTFVMMQIHFMF